MDRRRKEIGLGALSVVTLAEARDKAIDCRRMIARGIDPVAEKRKIADPTPTFCEAARLVHEAYKASWKNGKHQDQWINTLSTYAFPILGNRLVNEIGGPLIQDVLRPDLAKQARDSTPGPPAHLRGARLELCQRLSTN